MKVGNQPERKNLRMFLMYWDDGTKKLENMILWNLMKSDGIWFVYGSNKVEETTSYIFHVANVTCNVSKGIIATYYYHPYNFMVYTTHFSVQLGMVYYCFANITIWLFNIAMEIPYKWRF